VVTQLQLTLTAELELLKRIHIVLALQAQQQLRAYHGRQSPLFCVICGPKNVGKSLLARHLVNDFLQTPGTEEVALMEADCGQPAVGPPGHVSLSYLKAAQLLPATMCMQQPDLSVFVGDASPEGHPVLYLRALAKLAATHKARWQAG
jgi:polynucleotide 5'-kinase involved in rRNA processing